jgi:hypothetical protein
MDELCINFMIFRHDILSLMMLNVALKRKNGNEVNRVFDFMIFIVSIVLKILLKERKVNHGETK